MKNNLDKAFKDKLEHGTASYPEDLWAKIESQLPVQEDKNPNSFLFGKLGFLGLALVMMGLVALYFINDNTAKTDITLSENEHSIHNLNQETQERSLTSATNLIAKETEITNSAITQIRTDLSSTANTESLNGASVISDSENPSTSSRQELFVTTNASQVVEITNPDILNIQANTSFLNSSNRNANSNLIVSKAYGIGSTISLSSESRYENSQNGSRIVQNSETKNPTNSLFIRQLANRKIANVTYLKSNRRRYNAKKLLTECPAFVITGGKGIILDFYFSPDFAMREFNPRGVEFNNYSTERDNTENPYLSYSAGMRFSWVNKSGLALRSGINYTQINEVFKYLNTNVTGIDTIIKIESGTNVRDTTFVEIGETIDIKTHNTYRSLDVPLLIGLEMPFDKNVKLSINAGVFVNLLFQQKGRYIDQQGHPNWFVGQNVFKTSLGLSYYGSLGINYSIGHRTDFLIEPNLRYYSQSFTVNDYPLTQEYLKFGLLTGIRYHF